MEKLQYGTLDYENDAEIRRIAELHEYAPKAWQPDFKVEDENINQRLNQIAAGKGDENVCILVVRNEETEIIAFHWLKIEEQNQISVGQIHSLWVDDAYRRRGIATELKQRGEAWAKSRGIEVLVTTVFFQNRRMVALNQKLGYQAREVRMVKKI